MPHLNALLCPMWASRGCHGSRACLSPVFSNPIPRVLLPGWGAHQRSPSTGGTLAWLWQTSWSAPHAVPPSVGSFLLSQISSSCHTELGAEDTEQT